jgi:chaperonin GroES
MATKTAKKQPITPLFDNVLIKPLKAEEKSAGGIYLPANVQDKEKPQVGEIVAIGTGIQDQNGKLIPMIVKVGQKVLYKKWGGDEYKVGNEEWKLVRQTDILAIIE